METKFNIGDSVYLMYNNKPTTVTIGRIIISPDKSDASVIRIIYEIKLGAGTYGINENKVFATKEELRDYVFADNEIEMQQQNEQMQNVLNTKIIDCDLSFRAKNALLHQPYLDIPTIGDLIGYSKKDLLKLRGFGLVALQDVRKFLAQFDLKLEGD